LRRPQKGDTSIKIQKETRLSIAQQFHIKRKPVHSLPHFPLEVDRRPDALVDGYPFFSGDEVVGVRDDFFFRCHRHTVTGRKSQKRAFVRGEAGSGVAFNNAGKTLAKPAFPQKIRPALRMADVMGPAPADIMEHGSLFHEVEIMQGVVCCIFTGTVPYCPAVGNNFCAAPGFTQQILARSFLFFRHSQATS
jgi:hypothetical protein